MEIKAQPIDYAAGGFLRHRLLRSVMGALAVIGAITALISGVVSAIGFIQYMGQNSQDYTDRVWRGAGISFAIAIGVWLVVWLFGTSLRRIGEARRGQDRVALRRWSVVLATLIALLLAGFAWEAWRFSRFGFADFNDIIAGVMEPGIMIVGMAIVVVLVALLVSLVQALPRRLVAAGMLAGSLAAAGAMVLGSLMFTFIRENTGTTQYYFPASAPVVAITFWFVTIILLEFVGQAWWQLTTSRDGFYAARGWRPPVHRIWTVLRRHMGLPGFIANFGRSRLTLTALFFGAALFNAGVLVFPAGAIIILFYNLSWPLLTIAKAFGIAIGLAVLCYFIAAFFARWAERAATRVYQNVRDWDERAPVLFLRQFDQDDAKLKAHSRDPILHVVAGVARPQTMDELLIEHATPYGPVVAIGDPRGAAPRLGAARVFVEGAGTEWQEVVQGLARAACAVVMCPGTNEGVRWELDLVKRYDLHDRTIYLANPEVDDAQNAEIFAALSPGYEIAFAKGQKPIAAFYDPDAGWRILSTKRRSLQSYAVALNFALQAAHGAKGTAPKRRKRDAVSR